MALPLALPLVRARSRGERGNGPATTRPLAWVSSLLYVAMLVAGLYNFVSSDGPHLVRMAGFAAVLSVLIGLDVGGSGRTRS